MRRHTASFARPSAARTLRATIVLFALTAAPFAHAGNAPELSDVAWLAGHWRGESNGTVMEEAWLAPAGGMMMGVHRDVFANGKVFFEYIRIVSRDDGVFYVVKPSNQPEAEFRLADAGEKRAVFQNPDHDFPQRIEYRLAEDGKTCTATVSGTVRGERRESSWKMTRLE